MVQAYGVKPKTSPVAPSPAKQTVSIVSEPQPLTPEPPPEQPQITQPEPQQAIQPPQYAQPYNVPRNAPPMTIQDAMMMDWWEERQRRQRAASQQAHQPQAAPQRPANLLAGVSQIRQYAREMTEFQKALADLAPPPQKNMAIEFFNSNAGGTLMNNFGQMMQQLVVMWKEERQMKRQAMQIEQYQKTYEAMLAKHNQALQMRANAGSPMDVPPPPAPMPPDYNNMTAGYGQGQPADPASQLAQMYASGQAPGPNTQPLTPPPPLYQDPGLAAPPGMMMGSSRPRGLEPDTSIPGVGAVQYQQPNLQALASQQQAEIERLKAQLAEQRDRAALLGPTAVEAQQPKPPSPPKPPEPKKEELVLAEVVEESK